jgi:hypothetical protein
MADLAGNALSSVDNSHDDDAMRVRHIVTVVFATAALAAAPGGAQPSTREATHHGTS